MMGKLSSICHRCKLVIPTSLILAYKERGEGVQTLLGTTKPPEVAYDLE